MHFGLIGRIQLKYEQGLWNEWHLLFDDGKSGWLSEAGGEYVLSQPLWTADAMPAFDSLKLGQRHLIDGRMFAVTQHPRPPSASPARANCRSRSAPATRRRWPTCATSRAALPPSTTATMPSKPLVFVGDSVDFKSLAWANLRRRRAAAADHRQGERIQLPELRRDPEADARKHRDAWAAAVAARCSIPATRRCQLMAAATLRRDKVKRLLELGSKGTLRGEALEVIGFMRRHMTADGVEYSVERIRPAR